MSQSIWIDYNQFLLTPGAMRDTGIGRISMCKECVTLIMGQQHSDFVPSIVMQPAYIYIGILCCSNLSCNDGYTIVFNLVFKKGPNNIATKSRKLPDLLDNHSLRLKLY